MIFAPVEERRVGPLRLHGLFMRRQNEVAEVYGRIIADEVVTIENIGNFLLEGPRGDRTRQMLEEAMGPAIDRAALDLLASGKYPFADLPRRCAPLDEAEDLVRTMSGEGAEPPPVHGVITP